MTSVTQPVCDEHQGFLPRTGALRATAGSTYEARLPAGIVARIIEEPSAATL